jgi:microcystin-dependent protein
VGVPGWLICDGKTFLATDYPALNTLLGGTTLPNFTNNFPRGGTPSMTVAGAASVTLNANNLPTHTHGIVRGPAVGTAVAFARGDSAAATIQSEANSTTNTAFSIIPSNLTLYFMIKAI